MPPTITPVLIPEVEVTDSVALDAAMVADEVGVVEIVTKSVAGCVTKLVCVVCKF